MTPSQAVGRTGERKHEHKHTPIHTLRALHRVPCSSPPPKLVDRLSRRRRRRECLLFRRGIFSSRRATPFPYLPTGWQPLQATRTGELQRPAFLSRLQAQMSPARFQDVVESSPYRPQPREEQVVHVGVVAAKVRSSDMSGAARGIKEERREG